MWSFLLVTSLMIFQKSIKTISIVLLKSILPNVKIKSKETYSVSAEQVELNTLMTERVSDEYAFLGAFNNDLFEYYQMLIYREDDAECIKSVIGKQYNDEYFVIDLNEVIGDILDVVNEHAVEPF